MFRGLRGKIWALIMLLIIFVLGMSWILQVFLLEKVYLNQKISELTHEGEELSSYFNEKDKEKVQRKLIEMSNSIKGSISIIDSNGNVAFINTHMGFRRNLNISPGQLMKIFEGERVVYRSRNSMTETSTLMLGMPISDGRRTIAALVYMVPIENMDDTIKVIKTQFLYIVLGTAALSLIVSFMLSKFLSTPLIKMNGVARAMAGGDFTLRVNNLPRDEIGQLGHTLNFMATSLNNTLINLSKNNQKLNNILSSIDDGVIAIDVEGRVVHDNASAKTYIKIPYGGECIKKSHFLYGMILEVKEKNQLVYKEQKIDDRILAFKAAPYHQSGLVEGAVIVICDITRERNLERLRQELVANVSHELRTPISLIQGYSEALKDGIAKDINREEEFIEVIYSESERLAKLVEDILDMSVLESGGYKIEMESFDIISLVKRIIAKVRVLAEQNEVTIEKSSSSKLTFVMGDEKRIEQVLINLINNAITHTAPKGRVNIRIEDRGETVKVEVEDNGQGIAKEDLPYVWDRFYRADKSGNRKKGGTGLGLAIVKSILQSHNSSFDVESSPGSGTKFYFTLEKDKSDISNW